MTQFENLQRFLSRFKRLNLWQRLFGWRQVRQLSYDALQEFVQMRELTSKLATEQQEQKEKLLTTGRDLAHLKDEKVKLEAELKPLQQRLEMVQAENIRFKEGEEQRHQEHEKKVLQANQLWQQLDTDRKRILREREVEEEQRFEMIKKTWTTHEDFVRQRIKDICVRQGVEYCERHQLEKKPDCVIRINDEYIIFDAKAPADPTKPESFPGYVRNQTSELEKYAKQEGVRKELFLVVPSDVVHRVPQLIYQIAGYTVHVITPDALEPIIFGLKKLETYENLNELSPEERQAICGVIGKFVHLSKRRVQVDQHWAFEILSLLSKTKSLPTDFTDMIAKYERSGLYNPEPDRRGKAMPDEKIGERTDELERMIEPAPKTIVASLFGD